MNYIILIFTLVSMLSMSQACWSDAGCSKATGECWSRRRRAITREQAAAFAKFEDETGRESEVNSDFLSNFFRMEDLE